MIKQLNLSLLALLLLSGCSSIPNSLNKNSMKQDTPMDVSYNNGPTTTQRSSNKELNVGKFGYVHYKREQGTNTTNISQNMPKIDPEELADMVSRLEIVLPHVYDVATLVTDQHILIGYLTDSTDRNTVAQQVKQTAYSIAPRFYDIYISDEQGTIDNISRFQHFRSTSHGVHHQIETMINMMKKAPQGNEFYKKNKPADPGDKT